MTLKIAKLSKRFKDKWVLRDISFEVSSGEVFGISGTSGSGKTVLMDAIAGRFRTNGGDVSAGRKLTYSPRGTASSSTLRRLFRKPVTFDTETIHRNLVNRIIDAEGVLLLDDPFCTLDTNRRNEVESAIRSARERGTAIVVTSSDFEHILSVCDRAAILAGTELKQIGTPQQLYENPESRIVAASTGRCNLFAARRLSSSKAEIPEFHTIDGEHRLFAKHVERGALGAINQNVTLGIRPEHISISFGASFPEDNLLRASITSVKFLGAYTLIDLDSNGLRLQALVLRLVGLNVGDECVLGLPIDKLHIFRD